MTDEELNEIYFRQVKLAYEDEKITQSWHDNLMKRHGSNLDEIEKNYLDLLYAKEHAEYYKLLDRIEKGEKMLEAETDPAKKSQYSKLLKSLVEEMERVRPE